jgi:UPF0271 protein
MCAMVIDLNADLGERPGADGVRADGEILVGISSANVACGFHAGDGETMRAVCSLAVARRKRIGAHVGYLDREGFGRREVDVAESVLAEWIVQQVAALRVTARVAGGEVTYVKPHGALYNRAAVDAGVAGVVVEAVASVDRGLKLLGPPGSELLAAASTGGLIGVAEGFADRAYRGDGSLVPRGVSGAVLDDDAVLAQAHSIALEKRVVAVDGAELPLEVRSLCLHSDTPGAGELALRLRNSLIGAGCEIRPFS